MNLSAGTWFVVLTAQAQNDTGDGSGLINCTINTGGGSNPTQNPVMNFTLFTDDIETPTGAILLTSNGTSDNPVRGVCGAGSGFVTFSSLTLTATRVTEVIEP